MALRKPPPDDAQLELFSAIFSDIASRDSQYAMEYPFLNLSKKKRFAPIQYVSPQGVEVTVSGGEPYGIANIFDYDLIIWLLSQMRQALDLGEPVSRKVRFSRYAFLKDVRRHTGGDEYGRLEKAIKRLKNTSITRTLPLTAKGDRILMFSWIEHVDIIRDKNKNIVEAIVTLPEWLLDAVSDHTKVLTLHKDYFLEKSAYSRWLYRLLRKSAGKSQKGWRWKLRTLHERSGVSRDYKDFAKDIRRLIAKKTLLEYSLTLEKKDGQEYLFAVLSTFAFPVKTAAAPAAERVVNFLRLKTVTYEKAKAFCRGYDVYALEEIWREYNAGREHKLHDKDAAFIAFCKKHIEKNPIPAR